MSVDRSPQCCAPVDLPVRLYMDPATLESRAHGSQVDVSRPYPANVCRLFCLVEFASFGEDFGQAIGEPIEPASGRAIRQRTTEHLHSVLSEE